jgi:hypothetical protein
LQQSPTGDLEFQGMDFTHKETAMFLIFAAILMVGIGLCNFVPRNSVSPRPVGRRCQGLRSLAFALGLALVTIPMGAWAKAPAENSAQVLRTRPGATAPIATEARAASGQDYASREASAKDLEKFEGGSTTVVFAVGGSVLVVVLIVVLILVIL